MLSGYSEPLSWNKLAVAPIWLKDKFLYWIKREKEHALNGEPARIIAKMNSLCDQDIIAALYEASEAGVEIDLIVRGICSLKTGIPGISERIRVRSIVGRFLEHSRIFYFENKGKEEIYCGSADWMPRNLERRVEIVFPIEEENLRKKIIHILEGELRDTLKASIMTSTGIYEKVDRRGKESYSSQGSLVIEAREAARAQKEVAKNRVFIPAIHLEEE